MGRRSISHSSHSSCSGRFDPVSGSGLARHRKTRRSSGRPLDPTRSEYRARANPTPSAILADERAHLAVTDESSGFANLGEIDSGCFLCDLAMGVVGVHMMRRLVPRLVLSLAKSLSSANRETGRSVCHGAVALFGLLAVRFVLSRLRVTGAYSALHGRCTTGLWIGPCFPARTRESNTRVLEFAWLQRRVRRRVCRRRIAAVPVDR